MKTQILFLFFLLSPLLIKAQEEKSIPCDSTVMVIKSFVPNGDGLNDVFAPYFQQQLVYYELNIYNRWGNPVFTSHDLQKGWDGMQNGRMMPTDVYVWHLEYRYEKDGALYECRGQVSLIL